MSGKNQSVFVYASVKNHDIKTWHLPIYNCLTFKPIELTVVFGFISFFACLFVCLKSLSGYLSEFPGTLAHHEFFTPINFDQGVKFVLAASEHTHSHGDAVE